LKRSFTKAELGMLTPFLQNHTRKRPGGYN